jgi:hypothetical protein
MHGNGEIVIASIAITFPEEINEQGRPMLWFGSWLVGGEGQEGAWFHSGRGAGAGVYDVHAEATGLRIRKWPNDGFEAEYADVLDLSSIGVITADELDFDIRKKYCSLPEDFG